jgi:hypothetical protein
MSLQLTFHSIEAEMVTLWGREQLVTCPVDTLRDLGISECARRLLTDIGLPKCYGWRFLADVQQDTPGLKQVGPQRFELGADHGENPSSTSIVLDGLTGRVVQLYRCRDQPEVEFFVNSSLEQFAAFLILHRRLLNETARAATEMGGQNNTGAALPTEAAYARYEAQIGEYLA